jgi:hypothetical protein
MLFRRYGIETNHHILIIETIIIGSGTNFEKDGGIIFFK